MLVFSSNENKPAIKPGDFNSKSQMPNSKSEIRNSKSQIAEWSYLCSL